MATTSSQYQSYLLRLWSTGDNSKQRATLRATLLNVHNPDEQHHFATLDELVLFLNDSFFHHKEADDEIGEEPSEEGGADRRGSHRHRTE